MMWENKKKKTDLRNTQVYALFFILHNFCLYFIDNLGLEYVSYFGVGCSKLIIELLIYTIQFDHHNLGL